LLLYSYITQQDAGNPGAEECRIIAITDGDTLRARCAGELLRIRLADIDAPEKTQEFGEEARQSLGEICARKTARIQIREKDRYARSVATVECAGTNANEEQVRRGMAWAYQQYLENPAMMVWEREARAQRRGLWSRDNPVAPWEFRKNRAERDDTDPF
jgi:endonuclease YncB( thermonuclease family)